MPSSPLVALFLTVLAFATPPPPTPPARSHLGPPVSVFADLEGTWHGTFVGWDATGAERYRIDVTQSYQTVNATTQRVRIEDRMPDGTVVLGTGENTVRRDPDGHLELRCQVHKSSGERVVHTGRLVRGPEGHRQIIWYSNGPGRRETFRELVRREGERMVYEINGMGRYGQTLMLMHGRYFRNP